ncbi:MAG: hypothetical protein Q9163_001694 [Psora crenata]
MEGLARGNEAPLAPGYLLDPVTSTIHHGLQDRLRSVLVSRRERRPLKPSGPFQGYEYLPCRRDKYQIGNAIAPPRAHTSDAARPTAPLAPLESLQSDMVAKRSNVPSTESSEHVEGQRRNPSQPSLGPKLPHSLDGSWLPLISVLDQRVQENKLDSEVTASARIQPANSTPVKSKPSRIPRYNLRIVTPGSYPAPDTRPKPVALHVPGSYRSEATVVVAGSTQRTETLRSHLSTDKSEGYFGTSVESISSATAALEKLRNQGIPPTLHRSQSVAEKIPSALESSAKASPNPLSIASPAKKAVSQDAEPVHMLSLDQGHLPGEAQPDSLPDQEMDLHQPRALSRASSLRTIHLDVEDEHDSASVPLLANTSCPRVAPALEDAPRVSPVSKALSILSDLSGRSSVGRGSSLSTTTGPKHGPIMKPSELRPASSVPYSASAAQSDNQENEQGQPCIQWSIGKRVASLRNRSNLTARTNYRQNHPAADGERLESGTLPTKHLMRAESTDETSILRRHQDKSQSFSKVILDLENLLKEALNMAGKVASRENSEGLLMLVRDDSRKEHGHLHSTLNEDFYDELDSSSGVGDEGHRKAGHDGRIVVVEPDHNKSQHAHFRKARDATPYPSATIHQSAVPPQDDDPSDTEKEVRETRQVAQPQAPTAYPEPINSAHQFHPLVTNDWAYVRKPSGASPLPPQAPFSSQAPAKEQHSFLIRGLIDQQRPPTIQPRVSSMKLHSRHTGRVDRIGPHEHPVYSEGSDSDGVPYIADFDNDALHYHPVVREAMDGSKERTARPWPNPIIPREDTMASLGGKDVLPGYTSHQKSSSTPKGYNLKSRHHFSIREPHGFSLGRSHRRAPIARDWGSGRKRFIATATCITTALMGLIIGIYAGEVPAIQYTLADEHHYTILGNVVFFLGLAVTTSLLWPLPLLHGRKPYTLAALIILLPLQFPQALAVDASRSPYVASYRIGVLLPRAFSGVVMGFANINFETTLLDLFGASLQSGNPHQEMVNENDVRRHGGGIGAWLGIWTWCSIMSIGVGFLIGAGIISNLNVSWGFWITIILNAAVLLLNVVVPEVRRSPYRRSMAEVRTGTDVSRRIARGEIKMHLESTGPKYWYEEVIAGHVLSIRMLKQPGFFVLALYQGWIYGQVVMVIALLGALLSKYYHFHPQHVGLGVAAIPIAALLARTDSMTFEKRVTWTSHLLRRSIFMIVLPFAGLAYTLSSSGPPVHFMVPIVFAGLIGFLSNLAIAECNGIIMETFDTSDLQPGMTGRPRRVLPEAIRKKRTNFSCFPRVTAGFAVAQTFAFVVAAGATGWGGVVERRWGAQTATAVVAGVLLGLTLLLIAVLWRFKTVQIIPSERFGTNILSGPEDEWKPVIIGNPSGTTRRMNVLELGNLSRWSEIRRRNRLA